jgi:hypothetical protein
VTLAQARADGGTDAIDLTLVPLKEYRYQRN